MTKRVGLVASSGAKCYIIRHQLIVDPLYICAGWFPRPSCRERYGNHALTPP